MRVHVGMVCVMFMFIQNHAQQTLSHPPPHTHIVPYLLVCTFPQVHGAPPHQRGPTHQMPVSPSSQRQPQTSNYHKEHLHPLLFSTHAGNTAEEGRGGAGEEWGSGKQQGWKG